VAVSIDFHAPWDVQIAQARAQGVKLSGVYYAMSAEKRAQAFTVSGLAKLDQVQRVADEMSRSQAEGKTLAEFQKWAKTQDWQLPKHRLETIYRNAVQTSYQAGHWRDFEENAKERPYLMYDAINDSRVRPSHLALDGIIKPVGDSFWLTHSTPMGHRCRCTLRSLNHREAMAKGGVTQNVPVEGRADAGWGHKPTEWGKTLDDLKAAKIAKANPVLGAAAQKAAKKARPWALQNQTPETDWHDAAFIDSPQWIKDAVAKRGKLLSGITNAAGKDEAWFSRQNDSIDMDTMSKTDNANQGTWRHEFGHALDFHLRTSKISNNYRSGDADFSDAMKADSDFLKSNYADARYSNDKAIADNLQNYHSKHIRRSLRDFMGSSDKEQWLSDRYKANGFDFADFKTSMQDNTDFAVILKGVGLNMRYKNIIDAIELKDGQKLLDALTGGKGSGVEFKNTYEKGIVGKLSDLLGSATKNKVAGWDLSGMGHDDIYYMAVQGRSETECFANLMSIYGDKSNVFGLIADIFTPKMAEAFKKVVQNVP